MRVLLLLVAAVACAAQLREQDIVSWIALEGGAVEHDAARHVIGVNLRAAWITDSDLYRLAGLPFLTRIDLSLTHITDLVLERLAALTGATELNLAYAEHITDAGIAHLKGWKKLQRLDLRGTRITDTALEHVAGLTS